MCILRGIILLGLVLGGGGTSAFASSFAFQKALNELVTLRPHEFAIARDIKFCSGSGIDLYADLYRAKSQIGKKLNAIIFLHDDLLSGTRDAETAALAKIAAQRGYLGITIDFRLSGDVRSDKDPTNDRLQVNARFPAPVLDVRCAVRWLRAHSELLGAEPGRVTLMGMGGGGYLALLAGLQGETDKLPKSGDLGPAARGVTNDVRSVISWSSAPSARTQYWFENSNRSKGNREISIMVDAHPVKQEELYRLASPMTYIGEDSAPVFSVHGTDDRVYPFDSAGNFDNIMEEKQVPHTLLALPGVGYEFADAQGRHNPQLLKKILDESFQYIAVTQRHEPMQTILAEQKILERQKRLLAGETGDDWW